MAGGRALGDLVEQRKTLVDLALFDELPARAVSTFGLSGSRA